MKTLFETPYVEHDRFGVCAGLTGEAEGDGPSGAFGDLFPHA